MRQQSNRTLAQKIGRYIAMGIVMLITGFAVNAQPPVTAGLNLRLEAAIGFSPNGALPATWTDLSTGGNDMIAASDAQEPTFIASVPGLGLGGLYFSAGAGQFMQNTMLNSSFSNTEATLFVVRMANTAASITPETATMLSISDDANFYDEFCVVSDIAMHHYSSGNFQYMNHQCFSSLPDERPVVLSGVFGTAVSDIQYYVNNIQSTNALSPVFGTPLPYAVRNRRIYVGTRFQGGIPQQFFEGYIFEVLAYNRKLSAIETDQVNNYLRYKYNVNYSACNATPIPSGTSIDELTQRSSANALFPNVPNPVSGQTNIPYKIGYMQNAAELQITDFSGKKVMQFPIAVEGAGSISFDAANIAAGIYICSLIVDGQIIDHKKMVVKP